jgi:hypothetical protein
MTTESPSASANDISRVISIQPGPQDTQDIEEFPLLMQSADVRALIDAARQQGLTAAGLARRVLGDYLRRTESAMPLSNNSERRSHP